MINVLAQLLHCPSSILTQPDRYQSTRLWVLGWLIIASTSVNYPQFSVFYPVVMTGIYAVIIFIWIALMALMIDFGAQWLGHHGKSQTLFKGLMISCLPYALFVPAGLWAKATGFLWVYAMMQLVVYAIIFFWQWQVVKGVYNVSTRRSIGLYFFPWIVLAVFAILVLVSGVWLWQIV